MVCSTVSFRYGQHFEKNNRHRTSYLLGHIVRHESKGASFLIKGKIRQIRSKTYKN